MKLIDKPVMVFDCQATGMKTERDTLLEVGWSIVSDNYKRQSYHLKPDKEYEIPEQVIRITGITDEELGNGKPIKYICKQFGNAVKQIARKRKDQTCPIIIHYARFEKPWIAYLQSVAGLELSVQIICTHEISRRLFPALPRKTLRAIAGYLGFSCSELRRSHDHLDATAFIWEQLISRLDKQENVTTFEELEKWNSEKKTSTREKRSYPMNEYLRKQLPDLPGVYKMHRSNGDLLYIGKATSLKSRVNSYFQKKTKHAEHILEMLSQASGLEVKVVGSALEAALHENDQIKEHAPPYNRALKLNTREICFYTADFSENKQKQNKNFSIGPIPTNFTLESIVELSEMISDQGNLNINEERMVKCLGITLEYSPDTACFIEGLQLFQKEYKAAINSERVLISLLELGTEFWRDKLKKMAEAEEDEQMIEEETEKKEREFLWTPEAVSHTLSRICRYAMFSLRRARWYCKLSESIIIWEKKNDTDPNSNVLFIKRGQINSRKEKTDDEYIRRSANLKKRMEQRQRCFDVATYDRMRILTTEIRRIVRDGRNIEVVLSTNLTLKNKRLEQILKWV